MKPPITVAIVALVSTDSNVPEDTNVVVSVRVPIVSTIGTGTLFKPVAMVVHRPLVQAANVVLMELTLQGRSASSAPLDTTAATVNTSVLKTLTALAARPPVLLVLPAKQPLDPVPPLLRNVSLESVDSLQPILPTMKGMSGAMVTLVIDVLQLRSPQTHVAMVVTQQRQRRPTVNVLAGVFTDKSIAAATIAISVSSPVAPAGPVLI